MTTTSLPDPDAGKSDEERRLLDKHTIRKVDRWLVPWLSLLYLASFLCRTNIGNARLAGMEDDLSMSTPSTPGSSYSDYNLSLTLFFIAYALCEPFTNLVLKRLTTPRVFLTSVTILSGLVTMLTGLAVTSPQGLHAARFFLGVAEAGLFPGVNYYLSCWYLPSELGVRSALFFSAAALAGSFGGLLAAAIALMDGLGGLAGWAWIFVLEGVATMVVGVASWWMVFDWPEGDDDDDDDSTSGGKRKKHDFLSKEERQRVVRRIALAHRHHQMVAEDEGTGSNGQGDEKGYVREAFRDWKTYGYMVIYMGCLCPLYAFSLFLPTIVGAMGHSGTQAQLLTVPPYICGTVVTVIVGFLADRTRLRGYCNIGSVSLGIIGFVMLLASADPDVQYAGTFLGAAGIYPTVSNTLSWVANNTEGSLKRALVMGLVAGWGNLNGVVSSNIYLPQQSPRFWTGHGVVLGYQVVFLLGGSVFVTAMLQRENKRKSSLLSEAGRDMSEEEKSAKGDRRLDFMYTI